MKFKVVIQTCLPSFWTQCWDCISCCLQTDPKHSLSLSVCVYWVPKPRPGVGSPRLPSRMWLFHPSAVAPCSVGVQYEGEVSPDFYIYIYIYAFSRRFYPKRLTIAFRLYIFISMCVPWESNPQPFALLTQCSTTEPQEHHNTTFFF